MRRSAKKLLRVAGSIVILAGIGYVVSNADGARYVPAFSVVKKDKGPVFREGCLVYGAKVVSGPCVYGRKDSDKTVVVFGDSHALQWTPALIEVARKRDWKLVALLRGNCTAALVTIDRICDTWRRNSLKRIRREKPGLVFVASNTQPNVFAKRNGKRLGRAASEPILRQGLYRTLLALRKSGAEVTLMRDLPMANDFLPSECVKENRKRPSRCSFRARRPLSEAYDLAAAKRLKRVQVVDPLPQVCPGHTCRAVRGRILTFRDRGHISATYSRTLAGWLGHRLQDPWRR